MDKKEFRVLMKHCFLAAKILLNPGIGLVTLFGLCTSEINR
jgi:hypothetical protein